MDAKLIEKVKKLLALANDGRGNEAEAEAALVRAQKLMAEHNLTLAMVDAGGGQVDAQRQKQKFGGQAMYKYQQKLMATIAHVNFCGLWITKSRRRTEKGGWSITRTYVLVGRDVNVIAARQMFEYLNTTMERLVPIEDNRMRLSRWALSWKEGCSEGLRSRLWDRHHEMLRQQKEAAEQRAAQPAGKNELVVRMVDYQRAESDANHETFYNLPVGHLAAQRAKWEAEAAAAEPVPEETPKEKAAREKREKKLRERWEREARREAEKRDWGAFRAGQEEAEHIRLDPQLGETAQGALA